MAYTRTHKYRGFSITTLSTELKSTGLPPARQFEGRYSVVSEGGSPVAWNESGDVVFDTRVHASMNARRAARRSIDTYLLSHAH
jgi:hypothetical protein